MTPAAVRTVEEESGPRVVPVPRSEIRRMRRERRVVLGTGIILLCLLVGVVVLVLEHLHQGRAAPGSGTIHSAPWEVHVTDKAA